MPVLSDKKKQHCITYPKGFKTASGAFGIKASGKPDLTIIASDIPCSAAAVMSTTSTPANPILLNRVNLKDGKAQAMVCNSGVSNAMTGKPGYRNAQKMTKAVGTAINCKATDVIVCSTGIIGEPLPIDKITNGIATLATQLTSGEKADALTAKAILTTDLFPKWTRKQVNIDGKQIRIGGIAKGSGMIAPNMATMLGFITTDASISPPMLRAALKQAVDADGSFNRLSVDSDTSTSDTVSVLANGLAGNKKITRKDESYQLFVNALSEVCQDLAYKIIADGEGVRTVIRVQVSGAKNDKDALTIARSIADSPLVKTAVHGCDPNWGRIAMASGKAGISFDLNKLSITIGSTLVLNAGQPVKFNPATVSSQMKKPELKIIVSIGKGPGSCTFLGCDLSKQYVTINADYHT